MEERKEAAARGADAGRRAPKGPRRRLGLLVAVLLGLLVYRYGTRDHFPRRCGKGRSEIVAGERVVYLRGTPEEMGRQHGRLLKWTIRRGLKALIGYFRDVGSLEAIRAGARQMEPFIPEEFRRELKACAAAAGVPYIDLVVANTFGDIERTQACETFVAFGPATRTGEMVVGRNLDFTSFGVAPKIAVILFYRPARGRGMVCITWAGICTGGTIINDAGLLVANNLAGLRCRRDGVPTLFLNRLAAQNAGSVEEAIRVIRAARRSCSGIITLAGGSPPDAAIVEFDPTTVAVRRPEKGVLSASNTFYRLGVPKERWNSRRGDRLAPYLKKFYGRIDRSLNILAMRGAYMGNNLHSLLYYPKDRTFRLAQRQVPAAEGPYAAFRIERGRLVEATDLPALTR